MQITFEMQIDSQPITLAELNQFELLISHDFPKDYRQHMLTYNGGDVIQRNNAHISNPEAGNGVAYFFPIKYGGYIMERVHEQITNLLPIGYIAIGKTRGGGTIILSLTNDNNYGTTKEWYPDGTINDLSPTFTQLINDQVEAEDY